MNLACAISCVAPPPAIVAFGKLLAQLNALDLTLPGDSSGRRLRFRVQVERDG